MTHCPQPIPSTGPKPANRPLPATSAPRSAIVPARLSTIPIAVPTAQPTDLVSDQVKTSGQSLTPRKTASHARRSPIINPPLAAPTADNIRNPVQTTAVRLGRHQLDQLADRLSPRDLALVAAIQRHRFLATSQAERLLFTDHTSALSAARTARRVIRRLAANGLIRHLERRMGGMASGSAEYVWTITEAGHRLLATHANSPGVKAMAIATAIVGDTQRHRFHEPSIRLLQHILAISEAALVLLELGRTISQIEDVSIELEPASWRTYQAYGGARQLIRPDLTAVIVTTDDTGHAFEDHWFLEIDLGTEHLPTLLDKCRQYLAYRRSGTEQARHDVFPVIVWIMHSANRREALDAAIAKATDIDERLFRVITLDGLSRLVKGGAV